ncbi:hypothetical protein C8R48DRAFT_678214 [Suillus tomentosus]|nr:hypothetical protein C8R48DRAFT_678214 [Suillus tomentosus]
MAVHHLQERELMINQYISELSTKRLLHTDLDAIRHFPDKRIDLDSTSFTVKLVIEAPSISAPVSLESWVFRRTSWQCEMRNKRAREEVARVYSEYVCDVHAISLEPALQAQEKRPLCSVYPWASLLLPLE